MHCHQVIKERSTRQKRTIKHPRFRPFDWIQAVAYLKNKPPGDLVMRPSSKGTDHLAVSWKIDDKVIQNIGKNHPALLSNSQANA